ncbi:hypothetical protein ALQ17_05192 [Pseudomonas fluorescens]|nr:hypothetical protein ALQ17_05192 [Pseudomonas fluorescens]
MQGALGQVQRLRHHFTLGLALGQQPAQHLPRLVGHAAFRETRQVLTGKSIMQQRHGLVGRGQRRFHVGPLENECVVGSVELQGCVEGLFVRGQVRRLITLQHHLARLQGTAGEPATQRQGTGQRGFGALPGRRQVIAMHRQNQRIPFGDQSETQVGTFGDDALVTHQAHKTFGEGVAGHQGIAGHMKRRRAHHLAHVQADRRVARELHRALPQTSHAILREARIGVIQRGVVQAQLLEQGAAIQPVHFQRLDYPHRPACRSCSFAHGVFLIKQAQTTARKPRILKWHLLSLAVTTDHSRLK